MDVGHEMFENWPEITALVLVIVGFIFSISINNAILLYFIVFLSGLLAGRFYFLKIGKQPLLPFFLIIIGLMLGYAIGGAFVTNWLAIMITFIIAWIVSHGLHKKGYIPV